MLTVGGSTSGSTSPKLSIKEKGENEMDIPRYRLLPVEAVANRILLEARQRGIQPPTNLMLQKLVYFAQGYALGMLEHPLFGEEIEAWTYGPVVPKLYRQLKHYDSNPVTEDLPTRGLITEDSPAAKVIHQVMDDLQGFSASQLIKLSHAEGSPWAATWRDSLGRCDVIPLWQMLLYFSEIKESSAKSA